MIVMIDAENLNIPIASVNNGAITPAENQATAMFVKNWL